MRHRWPMVGLLGFLALSLIAGVVSAATTVGGGGPDDDSGPVWFTSDTIGGPRINLIFPGNEPGTFLFGTDVARLPAAISAGGVRTLMVFEIPGGTRPVRHGVVRMAPGDRLVGVELRTLPSLPGDGTLAGVASTSQGDFALLMDLQFPLTGEDPERFSFQPALLVLTPTKWERVALPEGIDRAHEWRLVSIGPAPAIVEHRAAEKARVWVRHDDGSWSAQLWSIPRDARSIAPSAGGLVVERPLDGGDMAFSFVRGESVVPRGGLEDCPQDHAFAVSGDRILVVGVDRSGSDPRLYSALLGRDGAVEYSGDLRPISPISRRDIETLAVLVASAALTTVLFLLRIGHEAQTVIRIPVGFALAPTWKRVGAAVIDLAPAMFGVLWFWPAPASGSSMSDLTMAYGPWPPLTVGAIFFLHSTVGEWLFGRTIGKTIAGCRTVSTKTGRRPTLMQAAGRNFVKVACPPLAMVQAMSPGRPEPWGFSTTVIIRAEGPGGGVEQESAGGGGDAGSGGAPGQD